MVLGVSTSLALGGLGIWNGSAWILNELVYSNEAFGVEEVDIQTDGILTPDQLRKWSGVRPGQNLLALDLRRVKRDLELVPLIESAAVERILPRKLKIRVTEREPIAEVYAFQGQGADAAMEPSIFYIDSAGFIILPLKGSTNESSPFGEGLPRLTGIKPGELRPGHKVVSPQIYAALKLLGDFERSPMAGLNDIKGIDLASPQTLQVTTSGGSEVTFPSDGFPDQFARWRSVQEYSARIDKSIGTLDLAVSNYVPVRWLEASAAPPTKPFKNSRYRKKHV